MNQFSQDLMMVRAMRPDDLPFIYATWLNGLYFGNVMIGKTKRSVFYPQYKAVVQAIMAKPNLEVQVVCLKEDPDVIIAYAISEMHPRIGRVLHWVFTRAIWRRMGIAKQIVPKDVVAHTHISMMGRDLKPEEWVFYPYQI